MKEQEKPKAEIVKREDQSPAEIIALAIDKGVDLERVEKLLALQEVYDKNEGKKKYNIAMAEVHKKMPAVQKTEKNNQTSSMYAGLSDVINVAKPIYSGEGFSVCFYEGDTQRENHIRLCMDFTHSAGHKETYHYDMPLDGKGIKGNVNMTPIHGKSSSVSYGRRYLLCMGFNIATGDDDGNVAGEQIEVIDEKQLNEILDYIDEKKVEPKNFCSYFRIARIEDLPKSKFVPAINALKARKAS